MMGKNQLKYKWVHMVNDLCILYKLINFNIKKMNREQSRLIVEQKFRKYKQKLQEPQILCERDQNICEHQNQDENQALKFIHSIDIDPLQFMMTDPTIYDLHQNLKKESELRNKEIVLKNFPKRYQELLQKEAICNGIEKKLKQLSKQLNEKSQKHSDSINELSRALKEKQEEIIGLRQAIKQKKIVWDQQLVDQIKKKDMQIMQLNDVKSKCEKLKDDYRNSNRVIAQLREEEFERQKQTQRLILRLQQMEDKVAKANCMRLKAQNNKDEQIKLIKQQHERELVEMREKCREKCEDIQRLITKIEFKDSLIQMLQKEKESLLENHQQILNQKHEQLQQIRSNYLQTLKNIDDLEEQLCQQQQMHAKDNEIHQSQISHCRKTIQSVNRSFSELSAKFDCQQKQAKIKDQLIQSLQNQLNRAKQASNELEEEQKVDKKIIEQLKAKETNLSEKISQLMQSGTKMKQQKQKLEKIVQQLNKKVNENEQIIVVLKEKVEEWLLKKQGKGGQANSVKRYQQMIEKLKNQLILLRDRSRTESQRQNRLYQILLQQNKDLRQKLTVQ